MELVLGLHRLVRGQACAAVLEHAEQHRPSGDVIGLGSRVAVVGLVESDVRDVRLPAAGHRDVEVLPGRRRGDDDVGRVDGDALGAVGGDGVPEVEVLADVLGGSTVLPRRRGSSRSTTTEPSRRMSVMRQRSPFLTQPPRRRPQGAVVAPGDDDVADRGAAAVGEVDLAAVDGAVEQEPFGAGSLVESSHGVGRLGHEDAGLAGAAVGAPRLVGRVEHLVGQSFADPVLAGVGGDDLDLAAAQGERGVLLPLVDEAVDLGQLRGVGTAVDEERERAPGLDGLELVRVSDEQDLRSGGLPRCR